MGPFSRSFIGDPVLSSMYGCEHPLLYSLGTGRASHATLISGSCQQALVGIHKNFWVWPFYMGWIPRWGSLWLVIHSVSAPHFVYVTPSMGILFPLLGRISIHTFEFYVVCESYLGYTKLLG